MRCRINKRAKQIWGSQPSAERYAWVEAEFNKRRAKRESKERVRPLEEEGLENLISSSNLRESLFPAPGPGIQGETDAAGLLLANALVGARNPGQAPNIEAAKALKSALEQGIIDPRPFTEALRAMAANADIMGGINALLEQTQAVHDEQRKSEEEASGAQQSDAFKENMSQGLDGVTEREEANENAIVKALNAATALLNQMNQARQADDMSGGAALEPVRGNEKMGTLVANKLDGVAQDQAASPTARQEVANPHPDNDISSALQQIMQQASTHNGESESQPVNCELSTEVNPGALPTSEL